MGRARLCRLAVDARADGQGVSPRSLAGQGKGPCSCFSWWEDSSLDVFRSDMSLLCQSGSVGSRWSDGRLDFRVISGCLRLKRGVRSGVCFARVPFITNALATYSWPSLRCDVCIYTGTGGSVRSTTGADIVINHRTERSRCLLFNNILRVHQLRFNPVEKNL